MKQSFFLRAKKLNIKTGYIWIVVIHEKDGQRFGVRAGDMLNFRWKDKKTVVTVDLTEKLVKPGQIGLFEDIFKHYEIKKDDLIELSLASRPQSINAIQKKILGKKLSYKEIYSIISDIAEYRLGETEIAFFVASAFGKNEFSLKELYYLTKAMALTGKVFKFGKVVADKHSTGGLPGNRVTPIVVAIVGSYGIIIPKTSSRAVTSAAGTADTFEVLAPVTFKSSEVEELVKKTKACLVWGAEKIAPADDRIIKASYHLGIEPYTKMVVSIMAKKVAMGITHLVLDIPVGPTTKIPSLKKAKQIKKLFTYLARKFKIKLRVIIHKAKGPVGRGIGPVLEARDILRVLQQKENRPRDLEEKSILLAGHLLELVGIAKKGTGSYLARQALVNGQAWEKMKEIIKNQGGKIVDSEDLKPGRFKYAFKTNKSGRIIAVHNKNLVEICRLLGAPGEKTAGVYLNKVLYEPVKKGDVLFTLYTNSLLRLNLAKTALKKIWIYKVK
jgi:AMP phosphorylase